MSPGDVPGVSKIFMMCSVSIIHGILAVNEAGIVAAIQTVDTRHQTFSKGNTNLFCFVDTLFSYDRFSVLTRKGLYYNLYSEIGQNIEVEQSSYQKGRGGDP
jgi:hypothetical protein